MRIVRAEIERFMGLRRVTMDVSPTLQLIAGPNNSGKTTFLRALEFFFDPEGADAARIRPQNEYFRHEGARALTRVRLHFGGLTETEQQDFHEAVGVRSRQFWVEVRMSKAGRLSFQASRSQSGRDFHERLLEHLDIVHVPAVRVDRGSGGGEERERLAATLKDLLVRSRPGPETGAQRAFGKLSKSVAKLLRTVLERSEEHIEELALPGIDLEFQMPPAAELLVSALSRIQLRRSGTDIELSDEGTGIQSLLSLGILRYAATRERALSHVFLIEEPEAFLHPQLQRAISSHLEDLSHDAQVIATTHSPIIIDSTDIRHVCRLQRDPAGLRHDWLPTVISDIEAAQMHRHCDAKNSEFVFARKVVFCEGLSDVGAIGGLLGATLAERDVSLVAMGSADVAEYFVKLARRFGIDYLLVLDKDRVAIDRTSLRKAAIASERPFTQHEDQALNALGQRECNTVAEARQWRADAQAILDARRVYCLGNDIEGAIAFSYRRDALLACLGPDNLAHLSVESIAELEELNATQYRERLRQLVGSKGWNNQNVPNGRKLKQHVPRAVVSELGLPRQGSDLSALLHAIQVFSQ